MRKLFTIATLTLLSASAFAQLTGSGYYRVRNYGTGCYVWVCDNTGSINYAATSADMGAMQLWGGLDRAIPQPASVLYFDSKGGTKWDVRSQSTGIYKIISHYVDITSTGTVDNITFYQLSATESGMTLYLSDVGGWGGDYNVLGTNGKGATRRWIVEPIDASTDNYFGIAPSLAVGNKHYAPFYAEFPFSFASAGMKAYVVTKIDGAVAVMKEITSDIIPGATPVLIECASADKSDNRLNLLTASSASVGTNLLKGVYFCNEFRDKSRDAITAFNAQTMRVWNVNADGKLVLNTVTDRLHVNWWGDDGHRYIPANQSYLSVSAGTADELVLMTEEEYANREILVTAIVLNAAQIELMVGAQPLQLNATVTPANATNKTLVWSTSDATVATVDASGLVTAMSAGTAVITAKAADASGVAATCSVTVVKPFEPEDMNQDGVVDELDVRNIYQYIMEGAGSTDNSLYDINHDNTIDTQDILKVYEHMQEN